MTTSEVLISRASVVKIHLDALDGLLKSPRIGIAEAIIASMSLRFLFDRSLAEIAHAANVQLHIPAPTLTEFELDSALLFACGGYEIAGQKIKPYYLFREPGKNSIHRKQFEDQISSAASIPNIEYVRLGKFINLPCLSVFGTIFSRQDLCLYVANKCGGAHHSPNKSDFTKLQVSLTLAGNALTVSQMNMSAVFLEVLGTAWYLINAPAISDLRMILGAQEQR